MESGATFSPDGKWLAYISNATGDRQLYLVPADGNGAARQVTRDGINAARWNPAGGEILIGRLGSIWSLPVATQPSLKVGTAVKLFDMPGMKRAVDSRPEFDIAPDGRILLLRFAELDLKRVQIHVIQNLPELLRQRAAAL